MPLDTYAVSCCLRPYTSLVAEVGRMEAESLTGTMELGGSGTSTNAPRPGLGSDPARNGARPPYLRRNGSQDTVAQPRSDAAPREMVAGCPRGMPHSYGHPVILKNRGGHGWGHPTRAAGYDARHGSGLPARQRQTTTLSRAYQLSHRGHPGEGNPAPSNHPSKAGYPLDGNGAESG